MTSVPLTRVPLAIIRRDIQSLRLRIPLAWIPALLALASPVSGQSSNGRVLRVPAEYSQIQAAIEASVDGDTVLVDPGHYYENINYRGKDIVVTSRYARTGDPRDVERTIIDGSRPRYPDSASVVIITNPRQGRPVIQGFTITGGNGTNWRDPRNGGLYREGGGILSEFASPRILHNIIVGNTATLVSGSVRSAGGGAMRCGDGEPEIAGNVIAGNRGGYGGGVVLYYTAANVHNNVIVRNVGGYSFGGGGLWITARLARGSPNMIENNTIADNQAVGDTTGVADTGKVDDTNGRGGAMLVYSGGVYVNAVILRNNIIWGNTQRTGGAIAGDTLAVTTTYSDVQGGWRGVGNISIDPKFTDTLRYHVVAHSATIGAGDAATRPVGTEDASAEHGIPTPVSVPAQNDMGAYGGLLPHVRFP